MLEDDESFRARAKPQAVYAPGATLLPAVNMLKTFVAELLQWATLMPAFSVRLTGPILAIYRRTTQTWSRNSKPDLVKFLPATTSK